MNNLVDFLDYLKAILFILKKINKIINRDQNMWIFSSWMGGRKSDNPWYLYLDLKVIDPKLRLIWIVKDRSLHNENEETYYYLSEKGIEAQLECGVSFCSHSIYSDFFGWLLLLGNVKRIQLWHGAPYKKIMWDAKSSVLTKFKRIIFDRYDLIISSNEYLKNTISKAFRVNEEKVLVSGYPRVRGDLELRKHNDGINKILYAPTFRDGSSELYLFDRYGMNFDLFNRWLVKKKKYLYIRLHPKDILSGENKKSIENASNIFIDDSLDIYESLWKYETLITDYSSIMFDYLAYEKRIIFAPFDFDMYSKIHRGVYFDYSEISVQPLAKDWQQVLVSLESEYDYSKLNDVIKKFGQNKKLNSSELIFKRVKGLF
ncbi:CDP-glycerol glycerophosphotransferase family protein [Aeromonas enteropelogenes]|uniref:CDP-glycerol glycerophosphotransferase family protein n=1 Tax=Aeromonas enteropelogenes TaxID=29489 RepID=UPI00191F054F|nr:CDP-glycerol glycerophosphotransferase family protein [Aeromonas enteropelogenes]MBL0455921.1 CDP-glycerol glycerophosphotransferase family protein [Aeromonas enteropelogenes]